MYDDSRHMISNTLRVASACNDPVLSDQLNPLTVLVGQLFIELYSYAKHALFCGLLKLL